MRSRFILLVVAILLIAGFAALNWAEITRPSPLLFGPVVMDAPLGAILLGLLALAVVIFALAAGTMRTQGLLESRHHFKELEAQRALADKAEASRFTDLRQHLDTQLRELRDRDAIAATEMEKARMENQREIRTQLEQINRTVSARLNELEHRLESRFERMGVSRAPVVGATAAVPAAAMRNDLVQPGVVHEHAAAEQAREHQAQMREEERIRDERIREERERTQAGERPAESGWRKWF
ncbi:MAG: hypothetical protein EOO30_00145 [Comamonadaceae bacterium]|nr:MAG: hypothetical protein EOO30_00145 [Comamonadaceae bacterium]